MSYILDALRRSERERSRRETGPSIIMPAPPAVAGRRWLPWLMGAALAANAFVIAILLLQGRPTMQPPSPATLAEPAAEPVAAAESERPAPALADVAEPPPAPSAAAALPAHPTRVVETAPAAVPAAGEEVQVPLLETMPAEFRQSLPAIGISVHVYALQPSARWVLANGQRLREGQEAAAGVRLERITPDGVVLAFRGSSFLLRVR